MITPEFRLSQTDSHLTVIIRVPYVKIQKSEFHIEENEFRFYLHPYSLLLKFQENLKVQEYPDSCKYDYETYELHVQLKKQNNGEIFQNLEMLSLLVQKSTKKYPKKKMENMIQVLNSVTLEDEEEKQQQSSSIEQPQLLLTEYKYGFNNEFSDYYKHLEDEMYELHQLNPAEVKITDRKLLRDNILKSQFDEEHYLYDLYSNEEELSDIMGLPFNQLYKGIMKQEYNEQQTQQLIKLAKKEILIENEEFLIKCLADLLFPFCYEWRVMGGDELTSESALTINKCSSLLSCHTIDDNMLKIISQSFSRCLTYPLIRNFSLACKVLKEMKALINENGKLFILKALLEIKKIFSSSEPRYLLNNLYIDSFCLFIQQVPEKHFLAFKEQLLSIEIDKADLILNLQEVEDLAVEELNEQVQKVL